jgi:hypothetical protein
MENDCKGCNSLSRQTNLCSAGIRPQLPEIKQCPCIKCLVKTMCNTACEKFQDYKILCREKVRDANGKRM